MTVESTYSPSQIEAFEKDLRARVRGTVSFDRVKRGIYSTDASIYRIDPVAVFTPLDEEDVIAAVTTAAEHKISILCRGGGTSLAGQTVGSSLVIDFSKHMNRILEMNVEERWRRVQPGVVRDELNAVLAPEGLHYAPDPATSNRANVGGMIANNSSGTKSIIYGKTVDHTLETKVLLTDGTILNLRELSPEEYERRSRGEDREAEILRGFKVIVEKNRDEIETRYPKVMRRVGGYNLDEFIHTDRWNLAKLFSGSEGTLATLLEAKIKLEPLPKSTSVVVAHFAELLEAIRAVEPILAHGPSAVEILDRTVLRMARKNLSSAPLCGFIENDPAAVLIVEFFGDSEDEVRSKAEGMSHDIRGKGMGYSYPLFLDAAEKQRVWDLRKSGLGLMLGLKGQRTPIPFIEDAALPVRALPEYIEKVLKICEDLDTDVAMYAHASVGLIHVRPILDLRQQEDIDRMKTIANGAFEMVKEYGGSWSGEHGDGLVRSPFLERFFGPQLYDAFREVKNLFDPEGLMNPGKIVDAPAMDQDLRYGTDYKEEEFPTEYRFKEDGDFGAAVELCTGVGACRKSDVGTMCPSYMATREEEHSTRGRANALRLAMTGQFGPDGLTCPEMYEVLDLCLSCKACKSECPSNVDMARLKGEFLQRYHDAHGLTRRDRLIGSSSEMAERLAGWKAPWVNAIQSFGPFKKIVEGLTGFDCRRRLPTYASRTLMSWCKRRGNGRNAKGKRVVLFADTYANFHEPNIGQAAVELLESCGYGVSVVRPGCCQRPRISHGLLRDAKREGMKTLRGLDEYLRQGLPVVALEPSCASAFTDDWPDLIDDDDLGERLKAGVQMIDLFLAAEIDAGNLDLEFSSPHKRILIHGHCHQKALYGTDAMKKVLSKVPGLEVEEVDSGCCGMAGSFGYEKEHYEISKTIAEDRLLPAIRKLTGETQVVACGFSCRHQIADFSDRKAVHWVETLRVKA